MKKTVNINLNSFMFSIDEDGFAVLHDYLGKLNAHFLKTQEGSEIIRDIEARIAEIFQMKISASKQVITLEDVNEVIEILGCVEDITGDNTEEQTQEKGEKSDKGEKREKKLYRNPDDSIIGGVCSGLAEYTGVSTTTWRIIFLILLFAGQVGLIAYIILWIAVPEAKTTAQKIEMKGVKITLSSIEKKVKEEFDGIKKNFEDNNQGRIKDFFQQIGQGLLAILHVIGKFLEKSFGILFMVIGAILITGLTIGLLHVNQHQLLYTGDVVQMIWLPGLLELITSPETAWFLSFCILLLALIPLLAILNWGISLFFGISTNRMLGKAFSAAWLLALFFTIASLVYIALEFRSVEENVSSMELIPDKQGTYSIGFGDAYKDFRYEDDEDIENLDELDKFLNRHFLLEDKDALQSFVDFDFEDTDGAARIEIRKTARGATFEEAEEHLALIQYELTQDSGQVHLSPYYQLDGRKYRGQFVKVKIYTPANATVYLDRRLQAIKENY